MKNVVLSEKERLVLCDILKSSLKDLIQNNFINASMLNHKMEDVKSLCYKVGAGKTFEKLNK